MTQTFNSVWVFLVFIFFIIGLPNEANSRVQIGDQLPSFALPEIGAQAKQRSSSEFMGKVLLVDFWASWCDPCVSAFKEFDQLQKKLGNQDFVVIGINVDQTVESAREFIGKNPVSFVLLFDNGRQVVRKFRVGTMPTSYLVNRQGSIEYIQRGFLSDEMKSLEEKIKLLLRHPKKQEGPKALSNSPKMSDRK